MQTVKFIVPGEPQGKARARTGKGFAYTPEKTVLYENLIKTEYRSQCGNMWFENAFMITVTAHFSIPKSYSKKKYKQAAQGLLSPTKKPDADNIAKVVCDALNGVAYHDDSAAVELIIRKRFSETAGYVEVEICEVIQ